ncbi:MAG TPA: ribonuclease D [Rhodospirillaceae bacterium]|nr:ribonuclease D [Rhodospirillaceae bacterium]
MSFITTTAELQTFCASLDKADFVTVDTEFMRERSYYSKLCLVQLGGPESAAAIDTLAEELDLTPLFDLLDNPKILKVFHAARQDIEIFVNLTDRVPAPFFDTQVAAMVCGFGEAASYETLAKKLANAKIDKTSRFTDWARRPLTPSQINYAIADVTHLRKVYEKLSAKIEKTDRQDWVREEIDVLTNLDTYQIDPYTLWKKLKLRSSKPHARAILRELVAWREIEAQKSNLPRGHLIKDNSLIEIASHAPKNREELIHTRGINAGFVKSRHGAGLLDAVKRGLAYSAQECPEAETKRLSPRNGTGAILDLLKVLLHQVSDEHDVAAKLIASSKDLERLASEEKPDIKTLSGWRLKLFGETALALKRGDLALVVKKGKLTAVDI